MNESQFVLISVAYYDENHELRFNTGTGYFVAPNLVLTSKHVLPDLPCEEIEVRRQSTGVWLPAKIQPYWTSQTLDAVLLYSHGPDEIKINWHKERPDENKSWYTTGYPIASKKDNEYTSAGIIGDLNFLGGAGQNKIRDLDLTVTSHPDDPTKWKGISGSPVFIKGTNQLIGIIKKVPENYTDRLVGVPAYELFNDPSFVVAVDNNQFKFDQSVDVLIVTSENAENEQISSHAKAALKTFPNAFSIKETNVLEILKSKGSLLTYIKFICETPIMIIDATGFQPGIMLLMGLRAVVKRGVTVVLTTHSLLDSDLTTLPFNIQQIKQISTNVDSYGHNSSLAIKNRIAFAISQGLDQLSKNPQYLDQPAYDAVRNPISFDIPEIKNKCLLLCPYSGTYYRNFLIIHDYLSIIVLDTKNIIRMLDILSPQLVGQSLYEHIRWADQCVVDWTMWLPNVFYELGVRLASSDVDPASLIEKKELTLTGYDLTQKQLLIDLFEPFVYDLATKQFPKDLEKYLEYVKDNSLESGINHNDTKLHSGQVYSAAQQYYDWRQEKIDTPPHLAIKADIERKFGKDRQKAGNKNILFAANKDFTEAIQKNIKDSLLGAWYYSLNTYKSDPDSIDEAAKNDLKALGQFVMEALDTDDYQAIKLEIFKSLRKL